MTVDDKAREQTILDAAAELIIRHGYNKTTMSDVADAAGLGRGLVYLHFKSKDELLEALITREMVKYGEAWFAHLQDDPKGGTIASILRSVAAALRQTPFMAAIVTRDEGTFGKYLRKPANIFEAMQTPSMTRDLMQALQDAGAIRQGVNIPAMAYIMDTLSHSLVEAARGEMPPHDDLLETMAEMFDRMLTPEDGGNVEAGKAVLRQMAENARVYFDQLKQSE